MDQGEHPDDRGHDRDDDHPPVLPPLLLLQTKVRGKQLEILFMKFEYSESLLNIRVS